MCVCASIPLAYMKEWMLKYLISQLSAQPHLLRWVVTHVFHNRWTVQLRNRIIKNKINLVQRGYPKMIEMLSAVSPQTG